MNEDTQLLTNLETALVNVIAAGIRQLAEQEPGAAERIAHLIATDQVLLRTTCEQQPLSLCVEVVRRDGTEEPVTIFRARLEGDKSAAH